MQLKCIKKQEVTFQNTAKLFWKKKNCNTALVLCSETPPSQCASKLTASGNLEVPLSTSAPSAAALSTLQTSYQGNPESESSWGIPLSRPCTRLGAEVKTPGTASNSSSPCHYLHIPTVLWTLVFGPARIVKFSGVATPVIRGRDCLMLTSWETKSPPCFAHLGIF